MSHPAIGRFFSPRQALIAVGIGLAGVACGALVVYRYYDAHRISIVFVLLTLLLLLVSPIYFVGCAFPKGCKACRHPFTEKWLVFPAGWKEVIERFLAVPDQDTFQKLCQAPSSGPYERALLTLDHCATCRRIGEVHVTVERAVDGQWTAKEVGDSRVVDAPMVQWLSQIAESRPG